MKLPGFTAEQTLYDGQKAYPARIGFFQRPQIIPQRINGACWIRVAFRANFRCLSLGYSSDLCAETASDLADSVCDF
jgi:hypothetical protein